MRSLRLIHTLILGTAALAAAQETPAPPATPEPPAKAEKPAPKPRAAVAARPAVMPGMRGPYLGVDIAEITPERVSALKLKEERGVEITMVDQDAPAGKAGLKEKDVIVEYNGQRVEGSEQLKRFIKETPPGRTVNLGIVRDGQPTQVKVTLADRREVMENIVRTRVITPRMEIPEIDIDIPQIEVMPSTATGVTLDNLTPQLAEFFGAKSGRGVLVKSVERGSAAEKAGIKAGDVIVKVDNESIESRGDYRSAIRHRSSENVKVTVLRDKREQTVTMTLTAPRKESSRRVVVPLEADFDRDFDFDFDFDGDFDFGARVVK